MQKLGKYEILAELGHGAMGVVYKARDPFIGRLIALKTINSNLVDRPDLLERFYQEAQSAGQCEDRVGQVALRAESVELRRQGGGGVGIAHRAESVSSIVGPLHLHAIDP